MRHKVGDILVDEQLGCTWIIREILEDGMRLQVNKPGGALITVSKNGACDMTFNKVDERITSSVVDDLIKGVEHAFEQAIEFRQEQIDYASCDDDVEIAESAIAEFKADQEKFRSLVGYLKSLAIHANEAKTSRLPDYEEICRAYVIDELANLVTKGEEA